MPSTFEAQHYLEMIRAHINVDHISHISDQEVLNSLPEVKRFVNNRMLHEYPLLSIASAVTLIEQITESQPKLVFNFVCQMLLYIEEAVKQGYAEADIIKALEDA